jgi:WD40 repeat protein
VALGSYDGTVRVWNAATGQVEQTLEGHSDRVTSVAFSPDGGKVASGSYDGTVRVWNAATGQVEQTLEGHSGGVASIAFSPDSGKCRSFYSVNRSGLWVTRNDLRILYLPFDFRPGHFASRGRTLAIGARTGRVAITTFRSCCPRPQGAVQEN